MERPERFSARNIEELSLAGRAREASLSIVSELGGREWREFFPEDLEVLDSFLEHTLGGLLRDDTAWLVKSPNVLETLVRLLEEAVRSGYMAAASIEGLARLRCLLAMSLAVQGRIEDAHQDLCRMADRAPEDMPTPNGLFHRKLQGVELPLLTAGDYLKVFFDAYFAFLRRCGENDLAGSLELAIQPLTASVLKDEMRPGIIRALFFNREEKNGYVRLVQASVTPSESPGGEFLYLSSGTGEIADSMRKAADAAWRAAEYWLLKHGYPDGLESRHIRWQLSTPVGDPVGVSRYEGGSIGLPLAVAIISSYLDQPVPRHAAMTGALDPWRLEEGVLNGVDGIPEKTARAIASRSSKVYIPAANADDLSDNLALENRARDAGCVIELAESLDDVCRDLFERQRDGTVVDTLKDACFGVSRIFKGDGESTTSTTIHYRWHVLASALLFGLLFFLEGSFVLVGLVDRSVGFWEWGAVIAAAFAAALSLVWAYSLACAAVANRKKWAWPAGALAVAAAGGLALLLYGSFLPATTDISRVANAIPVFGVGKDLFFVCLFGGALLVNTFCVIMALQSLSNRGQFVTLERSLKWQSPFEDMLPLRCVVFPWHWGALGLLVIAVVLGTFEIGYYVSLRVDLPHAMRAVSLLMIRDLVFIAAAVECMLFYKAGLATVRRALL